MRLAATSVKKKKKKEGGGFPSDPDGKESACNVGDLGSIPGLERSAGEGHGNSLQYSCLRIPWTEEPGRLQSKKNMCLFHVLRLH